MEKKRLLQINTVCNTSTGKLMGDIQRQAITDGYETLSIVGRRKPFSDMPCIRIGNPFSFWLHVALTTAFDLQGYGSYYSTKKIIKAIKKFNPDIIHLHNLHGYYLNIPLLFRYLSEEFDGKIYWTFHDCWPITGHCAYFTAAECDKWQTGCHDCINKKIYPVSLFADRSVHNYQSKKEMFRSIKNLSIIVPSEWMERLVKKSFLSDCTVSIIQNGIDLETFKYSPPTDLFLLKYGFTNDKKIVLGVANIWDNRKGLSDFVNLRKILSSDYEIVLVGVSKKQKSTLSEGIRGIEHTDNRNDLAMLYSMAEVFINPSLEESFSLVTIEALSCGTPVIVLDTSAVCEFVTDNNGVVLHNHSAADYVAAIKMIEEKNTGRDEIAGTAYKYDVKLYGEKVIELYEK